MIGTRKALVAFSGAFGLAWLLELFLASPFTGDSLWILRQQSLYITGILSIALMSLSMLLAARPTWLEKPLGGLDRMYALHKQSSIWAIIMAAAHWLSKLASGPIRDLIGTENRPARDIVLYGMESLRGIAKDMGEWTLYLMFGMLVLSLWKLFPYRPWRLLHRSMPVLYLVLVFHTIALGPMRYWLQPLGVMLLVMMVLGSWAALRALSNSIGKQKKHHGVVQSVTQHDDLVEVQCKVDSNWQHQAGQFALVTFDAKEGSHPFTISSACMPGTGLVSFHIKALGDYTSTLANSVQAGQTVTIEGPYGCFNTQHADDRYEQVWVAGGIGLTPFLAMLQQRQQYSPDTRTPVHMHYCTRDAAQDALLPTLQQLCVEDGHVELTLHDATCKQRFSAQQLPDNSAFQVWFCGPKGLRSALKTGIESLQLRCKGFHHEMFDMR